ncbi:MAG: helix-turn-helix transcriptional regulator [Clostridia bacterium]|nr:helix-turn-helix transcriptional regulator [Clostridia bacterium]
MLDIKEFGEKLRCHRKRLGLTQEAVAEKVGVSAQAVSKWEAGDCLPDCFNLKALGETYGISLDILLETETADNIDAVAAKIEQLADEFIWAKANRDAEHAHHDLGDDLWKMWKGIYFIETGNKELQQRDKETGNLRVCSKYGMKVWDDAGVACVVQAKLREQMKRVGDTELTLLSEMCSPEGFAILSRLDPHELVTKESLAESTGIEKYRLNELLIYFTEHEIIVFNVREGGVRGYKLGAHFGIAAAMVTAAAYVLSKKDCCISEYISNDTIPMI